MDNFVNTEFGLLPPKKQFLIPLSYREGEFQKYRSFYSNKNFLEILQLQPSLYEEHKFLYDEAANDLYKKFIEEIEDEDAEFIKISYEEVKAPEICKKYPELETEEDFADVYNLKDNPLVYKNTGFRSVFSNIIENKNDKLVFTIDAHFGMRDIHMHSYIKDLRKIKGKYLEKAISRLKKDALSIINDTVKNKFNGNISGNKDTLSNLIKAVIYVCTMLSKEFEFKLKDELDERMVCDLYKRYVEEYEEGYIKYINTSEYNNFDKNKILSVLFSPSLFKKIEPFAQELSEEFKKILYEKYDECEEYTINNETSSIRKVLINDIMTKQRKDMYNDLNETVRKFYINLRDNLTEEELKEFLVESTMFDDKNKLRVGLMWNIRKLSGVIINEYGKLYKERDRQLVMPTDKFYTKILKEGTLLYRGYKKIYGPINKKAAYSFFALNPIYLSSYMLPEPSDVSELKDYLSYIGGIAVFRLKKDITVMDFSNLTSIKYMKKILKDQKAHRSVIEAFEESWKIIGHREDEEFMRSSFEQTDLRFMSWLCSKGYGGFIGMDLENMHDEVSICFSRKDKNKYVIEEDLHYVGTIEPEKYTNFTISQEPYISYPELNVRNPIPVIKNIEDVEDDDDNY
jgi:hypothetical protein